MKIHHNPYVQIGNHMIVFVSFCYSGWSSVIGVKVRGGGIGIGSLVKRSYDESRFTIFLRSLKMQPSANRIINRFKCLFVPD